MLALLASVAYALTTCDGHPVAYADPVGLFIRRFMLFRTISTPAFPTRSDIFCMQHHNTPTLPHSGTRA